MNPIRVMTWCWHRTFLKPVARVALNFADASAPQWSPPERVRTRSPLAASKVSILEHIEFRSGSHRLKAAAKVMRFHLSSFP